MPHAKRLVASLFAASLQGCSLAPHYGGPPAIPANTAYKEVGPWQPATSSPARAGTWWEMFGDPVLKDLEERIEAGNPDLAAAVARYDQARGLVRESSADLFPDLSVGASGERDRVSAGRPLAPDGAATYTDVRFGPSLSYEIDLFGRIRNTVRANAAAAQASGADVAGIRLGLQAKLADTYFQMRGLDARIILLRDTVAAFQRAFDLTNTRHEGGIASGIDVSRAAALLSSARAELSATGAQRAVFEHAIAVLVGETPSRMALSVADKLLRAPIVPVGIPSTMLLRRPDIAAAERRVAAANAQIGVARATLFPSLTLGSTAGFQSDGGNILGASNMFWALGPLSTALSVFDGGARRARVAISRAQFEELAATYRATVLSAFREVEDDLARSRSLIEQEHEQEAAMRAAEKTRDLALIRYRDGASDYLDVVTAQTAALDAQRGLLAVRSARLQVAVDTIRAIGGSPSL